MRNKGIAIRTILLLLIGVLVAGLLIYYVYVYFSGSALSREDCRARAISWCTSCWNAMGAQGSGCAGAWTAAAGCSDNGSPPSPDLSSCATIYYQSLGSDDCYGNREFCTAFIPM